MADSFSDAWSPGAGANIKKFSGTIYYVATDGSNDNDGLTPNAPKLTITAAITAASAGDMIVTKAGTYAEDVDLSKNSLEFHPEIGTIITGQSADQALLISAHYCKIVCEHGALRVNAAAGKSGVIASGNWAYINNVRVPCGSSANIGFDVTGDGCVLYDCRCSSPLTAAFKIQGDKIKLQECCTGGETADTSIGFWFTNSCDKARVRDSGSQGHASGGFVVDSGCTNGCIENCYSGGGDGKWSDPDHNFVWSNFGFEKYKVVTATLDGSTTYNLFKVTGAVKIFNVSAIVTTVIANTSSTINLELYSTNGTDDITAAGGPNIQADVVGTVYSRVSGSGDQLAKFEPDNVPGVIENANYRDPQVPIILVKDDAADTYIQLVLSDAVASGAIRFELEWEPVHFFSADGFVEVV